MIRAGGARPERSHHKPRPVESWSKTKVLHVQLIATPKMSMTTCACSTRSHQGRSGVPWGDARKERVWIMEPNAGMQWRTCMLVPA